MASEEVFFAFIPIVMFLSIVAIVGLVLHYRTQRIRAELDGGGEYRKIAEEAVRGQKGLLDQIERMNTTLKEIEQLLRQV